MEKPLPRTFDSAGLSMHALSIPMQRLAMADLRLINDAHDWISAKTVAFNALGTVIFSGEIYIFPELMKFPAKRNEGNNS